MSGGVLMLLPKFDESTKQIGAILAAKAAEKPPAAGAHPLKTELLQLCRAVTAGTLDAGKLCDLLANPELLPEAARPVVQSTLADVFWFLGVEMEAGVGKEDAKAQLVGLIKELLREKVVDDKLLLTRLDGPMLQDAGLVDDAKEFHKQQVRVNTKALYTQQKYNLLREQSEGYSKLVAELSELPAAGGSTSTRGTRDASEVIANIQSLIGYFDLDPNRVLDLVLETLEAMPSRVAHKGLLALFNPKYIPHMLGFKFQQYHKGGRAEPTPLSLYRLCALLIQQGSVKFEQVLPHMGPTLEEIQTIQKKGKETMLAEAKKLGQVNLAGGAAKKGEKDEKDEPPPFETMQPLGVLRALLLLHDWKTAQGIFDELEGVDVCSCAAAAPAAPPPPTPPTPRAPAHTDPPRLIAPQVRRGGRRAVRPARLAHRRRVRPPLAVEARRRRARRRARRRRAHNPVAAGGARRRRGRLGPGVDAGGGGARDATRAPAARRRPPPPPRPLRARVPPLRRRPRLGGAGGGRRRRHRRRRGDDAARGGGVHRDRAAAGADGERDEPRPRARAVEGVGAAAVHGAVPGVRRASGEDG